jgi:AcrR family transcriptional regulator
MSESGSASTSMRRLAAASGVNVATIYHYFPSKADLLTAVIDERRYGERLAVDPVPIDADAPVEQRLAGLLRWMWEGAMDERATLRLIVGEGLRGVAEAQHAASGLVDVLEQILGEWIADGFPELAARGIEPQAMARLLRRQLLGLIVQQLATGAADPDAAAAELSAALFGR